jgi:hypothetical protein
MGLKGGCCIFVEGIGEGLGMGTGGRGRGGGAGFWKVRA